MGLGRLLYGGRAMVLAQCFFEVLGESLLTHGWPSGTLMPANGGFARQHCYLLRFAKALDPNALKPCPGSLAGTYTGTCFANAWILHVGVLCVGVRLVILREGLRGKR